MTIESMNLPCVLANRETFEKLVNLINYLLELPLYKPQIPYPYLPPFAKSYFFKTEDVWESSSSPTRTCRTSSKRYSGILQSTSVLNCLITMYISDRWSLAR